MTTSIQHNPEAMVDAMRPTARELVQSMSAVLERGEGFTGSVYGPIWSASHDVLESVQTAFPSATQGLDFGAKTEPAVPGARQTVHIRRPTGPENDVWLQLPEFQQVMLGGPSAAFAAARAGQTAGESDTLLYATDNLGRSAEIGSGRQIVPSHAGSEPPLGPVARATLRRAWRLPTRDDALAPDFFPADVDLRTALRSPLRTAGAAFRQASAKLSGWFRGHDANVDRTVGQAARSVAAMREVSPDALTLSGAVDICLTAEETAEREARTPDLARHQVAGSRVPNDQVEALLGFDPKLPPGGSVWHFPNAGLLKADAVQQWAGSVPDPQVNAREGLRLTDVLVSRSDDDTLGLRFEDSRTGEVGYIRSPRIYASLGHGTRWTKAWGISGSVPPDDLLITSISAFAVYHGRLELPVLGASGGWTPLAHGTDADGADLTLLRVTSGGVVGDNHIAQRIRPDHAIAMVAGTERFLGAGTTDWLSFKACSRQNGVPRFTEVADRLTIGSNFGTLGVTLAGSAP